MRQRQVVLALVSAISVPAAFVGCKAKSRHFGASGSAVWAGTTATDAGLAGVSAGSPSGGDTGVAGAGTGGAGTAASTSGVAGASAGGVSGSGSAAAAGMASARVCDTGATACEGVTPLLCSEQGQWHPARANCAISCLDGLCSECSEGERQCKDGAAQLCSGGSWVTDEVCAGTCEAGECVDACTEGRLQCSGDTRLQRCDGTEYVDQEECEFVCQGDACVGECVPDEKRCKPDAENEAQSCDKSGMWGESLACPSDAFCVAGDCKPCAPGSRRCAETGPQQCSDAGEWVPQGACQDPTPVCLSGNCVGCEPTSRRCSGSALEECNADGLGWTVIETCTGDTPACLESIQACGRCTEGETQCDADVAQVCNNQGGWENMSTCSGSTPQCVAGSCVQCDPAQNERRCQDDDSSQQCDGAGAWSPALDCGGDTPLCRADLNASCGCEEGARRCVGNTPQACSGGAWVAQSECSGWQDYCLPATGSCVACKPDDEECQGGVAHACDKNGGWVSLNSCAGSRVNCGGCDLGEDCENDDDCNSKACVGGRCTECSPGERRCQDGDTSDECGDDGSWGNTTNCSGNQPVCRADLNAVCGCEEKKKRCGGAAPEQCVNGVWQAKNACSGTLDVCLNGNCVDCQPGQEECQNYIAHWCDNQGNWVSLNSCAGSQGNCGRCGLGEPCSNDNDCDSKACVDGSCALCSPGESQSCGGDCNLATKTCSASGDWGPCIDVLTSSQWNGPVMRCVGGGTFNMGSVNTNLTDATPVHSVTLDSFWMDETEVSASQYEACVNSGSCSSAPARGVDSGCNLEASGRDNYPVNCLNLADATDFCQWAGKRLPLEEEWEYAARGSDGRSYPWGNATPTSSLANWNNTASSDGTLAVTSKPEGKSPFGLLNMAGNVREWTSSQWCPYPDQGLTPPCGSQAIIYRGGGFNDTSEHELNSAERNYDTSSFWAANLGLRCARDVD